MDHSNNEKTTSRGDIERSPPIINTSTANRGHFNDTMQNPYLFGVNDMSGSFPVAQLHLAGNDGPHAANTIIESRTTSSPYFSSASGDETLPDRSHRRGNNLYGNRGLQKCARCRVRKRKCIYEYEDQPCEACSREGVVCGEKGLPIYSRSWRKLLESEPFTQNVPILEQAHQRVAWVQELSTLPNYIYPLISISGAPVTPLWLPKPDYRTTSVSDEVSSLLSDHFANLDLGLVATVVEEEIENYEKAIRIDRGTHSFLERPTFHKSIRGNSAAVTESAIGNEWNSGKVLSLEFSNFKPPILPSIFAPADFDTRPGVAFDNAFDSVNHEDLSPDAPLNRHSTDEQIVSQTPIGDFRGSDWQWEFPVPTELGTTCFCLDPISCSCPFPPHSPGPFTSILPKDLIPGVDLSAVVAQKSIPDIATFERFGLGDVSTEAAIIAGAEPRGTKRKSNPHEPGSAKRNKKSD